MPAIILPRKWLTQPTGAIRLNEGHELVWAMGLTHAWIGAQPELVWRNGGMYPTNGQPGIEVVRTGLAGGHRAVLTTSGSSQYYDLGPVEPTLGQFSVLSLFETSTINAMAIATRNLTNAGGFELTIGFGSVPGTNTFRLNNTNAIAFISGCNDGAAHAYLGAFSGQRFLTYYDGKLMGNADMPGSMISTQNLMIARRGTTYATCATGLALFGKTYLREPAAIELSTRPWQIYQRDPRRLYFDVTSFPVLSSLSVSNITSSGGRLTAST